MTTEEKAKAYDEALERARELIAKWTGKNKDFYLEDYAYIFPQLRESEEEKFRKYILRACKECVEANDRGLELSMSTTKKLLDYLEKLKEDKDELVYRLNGLMQDYIKEGKDDEEREHRLKCYQLFWDALEDTSYFEQKEQKLTDSEEDKRIKNEILHYIFFKAENLSTEEKNRWIAYLEKQKEEEEYEAIPVESTLEYKLGFKAGKESEKQKEQKPDIELIQRSWYMEGYHDREFGKEPMWLITTGEDGPKYELNPKYGKKLAEQKPADEQFPPLEGLDAIKAKYYDEGFKNGFDEGVDSVKPVEWGKEDEMYLSQAIETLEHENYSILADKLKSIRPPKDCSGCSKHLDGYISGRGDAENKLLEMYGILLMPDGELRMKPRWKPSEEQMEALMLAIEGKCPPTSYMSRRLEDLYDGLANTYKIDAKLD